MKEGRTQGSKFCFGSARGVLFAVYAAEFGKKHVK